MAVVVKPDTCQMHDRQLSLQQLSAKVFIDLAGAREECAEFVDWVFAREV